MPIRINLLAEAQAAEDLRRRDPVKRAILGGFLLIAIVLVISSWVQFKVILANRDLNVVQLEIDNHTNEYEHAVSNFKRVNEVKMKLAALQKLSASRFLQGNLLNALQKSMVDGVALTRLHLGQSYLLAQGSTGRPDENNDHLKTAKPATVTEKILLTLDARDYSANPGDQVNKFKDAIDSQPYFKIMLDQTNAIRLADLSAPQMGPDGHPFVLFELECHFLDHTR
jgi:hypothetical protein